MRCLQQCQVRILEKPAHGNLQKGAGGNVVSVKYGDELAIGNFQRFVEVTGLGMLIVVAGDVVDTDLLAENPELLPTSVIEDMHPQLGLWPVDGLGGEHDQFDDAQGFVIRGYKDVYRRPLIGRLLQNLWLAVQRPGCLDIAKYQDEQGVQLGQHQPVAKYGIQPTVKIQGVGQAPVHIADRK